LRASRQLGALNRGRILGPRQQLPPATYLHYLDGVPVVELVSQFGERERQVGWRGVGIERRKAVDANGACAGEQCRLKQPR